MMTWFQTYTGIRFEPLNPTVDMIEIADIAHALSNINRFYGHTTAPFSVAQHSVLVASQSPGMHMLEALLHDAAEAYCGDVATPIKRMIEGYDAIEQNIMDCITKKFRLDFSLTARAHIKYCDLVAMKTEVRDLFEHGEVESWENDVEPLAIRIIPLEPLEAEIQFLSTFRELER